MRWRRRLKWRARTRERRDGRGGGEVEDKKMEDGEGEERGGGGGKRSHWEKCAALHQRIRMVIKMASKSRVFFFIIK